MSGTVAVYQPHYYPRLHYLARAHQADVFVIYDDVEFSRRSRHHRAHIDYYEKEWLTVPVAHTGQETLITETRVDMSVPWPARHLQTLVGKYGSQATDLEPFYRRLCVSLVDPETLRDDIDRVGELTADSDIGALLDDWVRIDTRWRDRLEEYEVPELRAEKERLDERIGERKRADPAADIDDLLADAAAIDERLETATDACRELKERRNRTLVALSKSLGHERDVDRLPLYELWNLDGVDPERWTSDVSLADVTVPLVEELLERFDVTSTVVRSSEVGLEHPGDASEYLAALTNHFDGDAYLSGAVGYENYLEEDPFDDRGLDVLVQDWTPSWEDGNVCALDVLYDADDPGRYVTEGGE
ncbi:WbqC family protein [Natrinema salaciae]|uniref:WbqC-like protein family protein n=1 Tax=Natrinema salaciae TaxID=1186196 RepID=A0A1H9GNH1_9EURY|nr:WbqC family protein [Natrinema salaciae]SEQ51655.1 WbqC-like protein family protein [Natrinema salaciae]